MNNYEHTFIARQDLPKNQLDELVGKYEELVSKNSGKIIKVENWGIMSFSKTIKKNKKGYFIHFKFEGVGKTVEELEKKEKIDTKLLRFLTVKVKKFDLETNYFGKEEEKFN